MRHSNSVLPTTTNNKIRHSNDTGVSRAAGNCSSIVLHCFFNNLAAANRINCLVQTTFRLAAIINKEQFLTGLLILCGGMCRRGKSNGTAQTKTKTCQASVSFLLWRYLFWHCCCTTVSAIIFFVWRWEMVHNAHLAEKRHHIDCHCDRSIAPCSRWCGPS